MKPAELYILNQPEPYKSILLHLQAVVEHTIPELQLLYKWKIPFYYLNGKPFCYFNASHKKQFVDVAFMKGFHLDIHQDLLVGEGRSLVKSLRYVSLETIDNEILVDVLVASKKLYP